MSLNLSRTLFYEFYKSDPNFIYESVEEYRNYKSDPNFADKTIEEYRRVKASQKKADTLIHEVGTSNAESFSDERYGKGRKNSFRKVKVFFFIKVLNTMSRMKTTLQQVKIEWKLSMTKK